MLGNSLINRKKANREPRYRWGLHRKVRNSITLNIENLDLSRLLLEAFVGTFERTGEDLTPMCLQYANLINEIGGRHVDWIFEPVSSYLLGICSIRL